ncbi:DoxX family protein, partial [Candidatus Marinimicrobia bacterium]|nr:DoxX family protein [Candidatus Neomarinimicrobiota bacterium]
YGVYYSFAERTTLWIFYGFVHLSITLIFLLLGQRIAKDYLGAANLVPYFILITLGIMSMY